MKRWLNVKAANMTTVRFYNPSLAQFARILQPGAIERPRLMPSSMPGCGITILNTSMLLALLLVIVSTIHDEGNIVKAIYRMVIDRVFRVAASG